MRSWLIARREDLKTSAVLATVAVDRLIDGVVFTAFVPLALILVSVPDPTGGIRAGLGWGAGGSLVIFVLLLLGMAAYRFQAMRSEGWLAWCIGCKRTETFPLTTYDPQGVWFKMDAPLVEQRLVPEY